MCVIYSSLPDSVYIQAYRGSAVPCNSTYSLVNLSIQDKSMLFGVVGLRGVSKREESF